MSALAFIDNTWQEESVRRAYKIYPNQGVHPLAWLMARTHRFSIDYMEQAPALLVFASWGSEARRYSERALIASRFGSPVSRGEKLRDILREFHAPLPVLKIVGSACIKANYAPILALRKVPPSDLAQAIPEAPGQQLAWLRFLRTWLEYCGRLSFMADFDRKWLWAVKAGGLAIREGMPKLESRVGDLFDFLERGRNELNIDWSMRSAFAAMERWHRDLAEKADHEKFLQQHGFAFTDERNYEPLPHQCSVDDFTFIALRSGLELFVEGKAMRHCAASYVREVMLGGTRIYSMRKGEDRVATIELHPRGERFVLAQAKGHCNRGLRKSERECVAAFVGQVNTLPTRR